MAKLGLCLVAGATVACVILVYASLPTINSWITNLKAQHNSQSQPVNITARITDATFLPKPTKLSASNVIQSMHINRPKIECAKILPAVERMAHGVNIMELDLMPTDVRRTNGFKHELFDFT